jgi:aryl-alcohol dehydrogenase-like predicted oxidoreductase
LAIAYVVAAPEVSSVIVGTRKAIHLKKTITAAEHELSPDLVAEIRAHAAALGITVW